MKNINELIHQGTNSQVVGQVGGRVEDQVWGQVWSQVASQVWSRFGGRFGARLGARKKPKMKNIYSQIMCNGKNYRWWVNANPPEIESRIRKQTVWRLWGIREIRDQGKAQIHISVLLINEGNYD